MREGLDAFVDEPAHREALRKAGAAGRGRRTTSSRCTSANWPSRATGSFVFGEDDYDAVLRVGEGFGFDVHTLREMGREQVASLDAADGGAGRGDRRDVGLACRGRARCATTTRPPWTTLLRCYRDETERARAFVRASGLMSIPEGEECAVEPAPLFLRAAAPVASYFPPPSFGPRAHGTFNVPFTPDDATPEEQEARLRSNSYFEIPGVTAHEAYPGHHLHFAAVPGAPTRCARSCRAPTWSRAGGSTSRT